MEQTCPICIGSFNQTDHLPRIIPTCGHTLCSNCLITLINQSATLKCPLDNNRITFPQNPINLEAFPVNYALSQLLEDDKKYCSVHREEVRFACLTDKVKLCDTCICEKSEHEGHNIVQLKKIFLKANSMKRQVSDVLKQLDNHKSDITKLLCDQQKKQLKIIRELFGEIKNLVSQKENDLCFQLNYLYDLENERVNEIIGVESTPRNDIKSLQTELQSVYESDRFLHNNRFFENIQNEVEKWGAKLKPQYLKEGLTKIEEKLEKMFSEFHNSLLKQTKSWCELDLSFPDSTESLREAFSNNAVDFYTHPENPFKSMPEKCLNFYTGGDHLLYFKFKPDVAMTPFQIRTRLTFNVTVNLSNTKVLNISTGPRSELAIIDFKDWANVQIVRLEFTEAQIDDKDITVLSYIWRRINEPPYLQIKISPNSIVACYKEICKVLLDGSSSFTSVVIDVAGYQMTNRDIMKQLVDDILAKMTLLKEVRLIMNDINLKTRSQGVLFQDMAINVENLQCFSLKLSNTNIQDEDIASIFVAMPNIKKYFLDLEGTKVTDNSLSLYTQNTLPSMKYLETYLLNLSYTKVTDTGLKSLFTRPTSTVKQFHFFVAGTQATDQTLNALIQSVSNSFNSFETFSVNFVSCKMSDQAICQLFQPMSKVKTYTLGLSNTAVTDRTFLLLAKSSMVTMKALENFAVSLDDTRVTDVGVDHIVSNLGVNLKQLLISMHGTDVSDKSIESFVRKRLGEMKGLKGFKMRVTGTKVSDAVKAEIERVEKSVKEVNFS